MNKIVAIVGMAGSGKSIASSYFNNKGYNLVYFGGIIYEKMKEEGIEITPESQKEFREKIRKEHGMGVVAKLLLPKIKKLYSEGNVILDGLYSWDEYKILKEEFKDLVVIAIVCDKKLRYDRISKRKERAFNKEEIIRRDVTEIENSAKGGPIAYADYYLLNNGSMEKYEEDLAKIKCLIEGVDKNEKDD